MGDLLTGPQPPTTTAIKALLRRAFKPQGRTEPTTSNGGLRLRRNAESAKLVTGFLRSLKVAHLERSTERRFVLR
jgi:hypothetical protein